MSTRRGFLKMNLALVGVAALNPIANSDPAVQLRVLDLFVFDTEIPRAREIARRVSESEIVPAGGDLYSVWQGNLRSILCASDKTIAGVTTGEAAFCLSETARDFGYEIVQSEILEANSEFDPAIVKAVKLNSLELNRPRSVAWVMARTGVSFRSQSVWS